MKRILTCLIPECMLISLLVIAGCKKEEKSLPVLITVPASGIRATSVVMGGQIAWDGGTEITARGTCWGTEPNPDKSGSFVISGKGSGTFKCTLTGLSPTTIYYGRAFATNGSGTAFGGEVKFTTARAYPPTVETIVDPTRISYYVANIITHIYSDGGAPITAKGICWGLNANPDVVNDNRYENTQPIDTFSNSYMCNIGPLMPNSDYHVRAYAINSAGTSYGIDKLITTLPVPQVTTDIPYEITDNSATVGGNTILTGEDVIVEIGVFYNTAPNPTISHHQVISTSTVSGEFTCSLSNLTPATIYYVRAYVSWVHSSRPWETVYTVYGNEVTFTTN